ncbi:putative phospholipid-binding protein, BON family [Leptolyngbya sp. PCC 7375]|nr:putative phospholipid-binding protein, BON family [Leptolyngbya sp. PCC 7375]
MNGVAVVTTLGGGYRTCELSDSEVGRCRWFSSIPPERIGLHGEFDYYGLSKRVSHCLSNYVDSSAERLKVRQRGRVVVLSGQLGSPYKLSKIVDLALSVDGVDAVETRGVAFSEAL